MSEERCGLCRFFVETLWYRNGIAAVGDCHRRAPVVNAGPGTVFPEVVADDWCGEYQKKEASPAKLEEAPGSAD